MMSIGRLRTSSGACMLSRPLRWNFREREKEEEDDGDEDEEEEEVEVRVGFHFTLVLFGRYNVVSSH